MNPIKRQEKILSDICELLYSSADGEYDELGIEVGLSVEEQLCKFTFWQTVDAVRKSLPLLPEEEGPGLLGLSLELHKELMEHTGGDMTKYVLRISGAGRATVDYEYREPPVNPYGSHAD